MVAHPLVQLHRIARILDQTFKSRIEANAQREGQWNDLRSLKLAMIEEITTQREAFAKGVMQTVVLRK